MKKGTTPVTRKIQKKKVFKNLRPYLMFKHVFFVLRSYKSHTGKNLVPKQTDEMEAQPQGQGTGSTAGG